jgi:cytochrome c5
VSGNNDKAFVTSFAGVIGVLVAFTATIIGIGIYLASGSGVDQAVVDKSVQERIAPIGTVITDPAALMKAAAAPAHAPMSGEQIVGSVCSACHGSGMLGAPKIGDKAAWSARLKTAGGIDGLVGSAAKGKNSMPPRGGNPDLSNDELKAAIQQMLKQTGVSG